MGVGEEASFSLRERQDFRCAFDAAKERLPSMFKAFWHRYEEVAGAAPQFIVCAEDGSPTLRLTKLVTGHFRAEGITRQASVMYARTAPTIAEALRAAGVL